MNKTLFVSSLVLLFSTLIQTHAYEFPVQIYNFHITNNLPNNSAALQVQCSSEKAEDLGDKLLYMYEDMQWESVVFSWQTAVYFCDFWWLQKKKDVLVFHHDEAFRYCSSAGGFLGVVNECHWYVREDGFYVGSAAGESGVNQVPAKMADW